MTEEGEVLQIPRASDGERKNVGDIIREKGLPLQSLFLTIRLWIAQIAVRTKKLVAKVMFDCIGSRRYMVALYDM